jgi:hypothetical protein
MTNPQITDYHSELGDKILLFKRPVVPLDRALVSPLATIKELAEGQVPIKPQTEKKRKSQKSPDTLSKVSASLDSQDH